MTPPANTTTFKCSPSIQKRTNVRGIQETKRLAFLRQHNVLHGPLYDLDYVGDTVGADELAGVLRHVGGLDGIHLPSPGLSAPDSEDAAPGADIKNHLTDPPNQSNRGPKLQQTSDSQRFAGRGERGGTYLTLPRKWWGLRKTAEW